MGIQNWSENIVLVTLAEEPHMGEELRTVYDIVQKKKDCDVVIDFSDVDIITSSSIAKLLKLRKALMNTEKRMIFCGLKNATRGIFTVTGLEEVFDFVDDKFIALASLQLVN